MVFGVLFGVQNLAKMSQDGLQKPSRGATIAKRSDFEKCCFVLVFTAFLDHQASQESLKTAKKPPKVPPDGHQEPFQKRVNFLTPFWVKNASKMESKSGPKVVQKVVQNMTPNITKNGQVLGPKLAPEILEIGGGGQQEFQDRVF